MYFAKTCKRKNIAVLSPIILVGIQWPIQKFRNLIISEGKKFLFKVS